MIRQKRIDYCTHTFLRQYKRYRRRIGETEEDRIKARVKDIFTFSFTMMGDIKAEKSQNILSKFLHETSELYNMKAHLRNFYMRVVYI